MAASFVICCRPYIRSDGQHDQARCWRRDSEEAVEPEFTPTVDDLMPWMRSRFEDAYQEAVAREPGRSRNDFSAGYVAAILGMNAIDSFSEGVRDRLLPRLEVAGVKVALSRA